MASLAGLFKDAGSRVTGSDGPLYPPTSTILSAMGVTVYEGYDAKHLEPVPDLIVVGTHGRRGLGRFFMGSGAEQIIRLAPVPVLVVRSAEGEVPASGTHAYLMDTCPEYVQIYDSQRSTQHYESVQA